MSIWNELETCLSVCNTGGAEECQKIFHGPSGILPGLEQLIIDRLADVVFVISYQVLSSEDLTELVSILNRHYPGHFLRVQERGSGPFRDIYLSHTLPEELTIQEGDTSYYIHPGRGQNIGFFPDMINGRARIADYVSGQNGGLSVLNLFSYTCSFSVISLMAGAGRVDNWDMNRNSLGIGRKNHELNGLGGRRSSARYFSYDIFKSFGKLRRNGPYDLVIMDPPPYQGSSFTYNRDYPKLIRRCGEWLKEGGACLLCLNAADCGWDEFRGMIEEHLPGNFDKWEKVPSPPEYNGRYPDRALKCYFLTGWRLSLQSRNLQ